MPILLQWTDWNDKKGTINYDILIEKNEDNFRISVTFCDTEKVNYWCCLVSEYFISKVHTAFTLRVEGTKVTKVQVRKKTLKTNG
jgi:hypothetical protein